MPEYCVSGQVFLAAGFTVAVSARSEAEAEGNARVMITDDQMWDAPSVNEIIISEIRKMPASKAPTPVKIPRVGDWVILARAFDTSGKDDQPVVLPIGTKCIVEAIRYLPAPQNLQFCLSPYNGCTSIDIDDMDLDGNRQYPFDIAT